MEKFDVDFHIHSKYSGGTSKNMEMPVIGKQADLKGLDLVGTGDALHPGWLRHLKEKLSEDTEGIYSWRGCSSKFIVTSEIEDARRVHHLIVFPSMSSAESLRDEFIKFSGNIDRDGRPNIRINGEEVVDYVREAGALMGPAHVFTPWTALYKEYDSLRECYGGNTKHIAFVELGLSADSDMADRIRELTDVTFMTNSDTHSPWPHRLGREFNRLLLGELSFREIKNAVERRNNRKFILNVGLNPREGKYHLTSCTRCYLRFKMGDAISLRWRCPECRGLIKKGVGDRIGELSAWDDARHPVHRPPYTHILPLAEVISLVTGIKSVDSKKVNDRWCSLVERFDTEINVLLDSDVEDVKKVDYEVGRVIERFRHDEIRYVAGGGGQYGRPTLKEEDDNFWGQGQRSLSEF